MKCEKCSEPATVFLTQIVNGKMQKVDLCESCAKDMGVTDSTGFSLADVLLSKDAGGDSEEETMCPGCGLTEAQLRKTGRLGCTECYETFEEQLMHTVRDTQKSPKHVGKVPQKFSPSAKSQLDDLRNSLKEAIHESEFERAAELRDQIKALENQV